MQLIVTLSSHYYLVPATWNWHCSACKLGEALDQCFNLKHHLNDVIVLCIRWFHYEDSTLRVFILCENGYHGLR